MTAAVPPPIVDETTPAPAPEEGPPTAPVPGEPVGTTKLGAAPWVMSTYFAQGLPYSIVHQTAPEFFTAMGASNVAVGFTSLYGLAWNAKFLWSPLVDLVGTTRRWLIVVEAVLALTIAALAWPADLRDVGGVARALVVVAVLSATHDIAIDGFYMRALAQNRQAAFTGLRVGAFRVAMLVGKSLLVVLAGLVSWRACFLAAGAMLGLLALGHAVLLPREEAKAPAPVDPKAVRMSPLRLYGEAFRSFLAQPKAGATIAFILTYRAGDALMFAMSPPFLNHLGVDLAHRGYIAGPAGVAGIAGSIVGGALIARYQLVRTLIPMALVQSLAILLYVGLALLRPSLFWIAAAVIVEQIIAGIGSAALVVFLMRRCSGEYKASHFAIGSALMSTVTTAAGPLGGYVSERVGFTAFFVFAYAASIPGVLLAREVPKD